MKTKNAFLFSRKALYDFYRLRLQHKLLPPRIDPGGNRCCNGNVFAHLLRISATKKGHYFEFRKKKSEFYHFSVFHLC